MKIYVPKCKDGIDCIDLKVFKKIMSSNKNMIETLISHVNLDPLKHQHHNISYPDTKSSYAEVYEDKKWTKMKIDEALDRLIEAKIDDLNSILDEYSDFFNKKTRNKLKETIENFDYTKPDARKKLKTYLKPILYNHKDMINKTIKLIKKQENETNDDDVEIEEKVIKRKK